MKIEVWSDYVCPFCYIGKRELEQALKETGLAGKVDVAFKAYELDPTASTTDNSKVKEAFAKKKDCLRRRLKVCIHQLQHELSQSV